MDNSVSPFSKRCKTMKNKVKSIIHYLVIAILIIILGITLTTRIQGEERITIPESPEFKNIPPTMIINPPIEIEETDRKNQPFSFTLSFTGDMMLAEYKDANAPGRFNSYANSKDPTYFLQNVKHIFEQDDYTIVNLENVLSDNNLSPVPKSGTAFWFKSKTSNTDILTSSSVEVVSLANNHYGDYGTQGREDTKQAVINAGLEYGWNDKTVYLTKNNYTIALICHGLWSEWQANEIINRIHEAETKSDFQVVFFHGGTEGIHTPEQWKMIACHKMVDNGADLIIGNHPHVLQPREYYNGVSIIYSMGNFCYGGSMSPENRTIIYQYTLFIDPETNQITDRNAGIIPCYVYTSSTNNFQPQIITDEVQKQNVIDFMDWKRNTPF